MNAQRSRSPLALTAGLAAVGLLALWSAFAGYQLEAGEAPDPYLIAAQFTRLAPMVAAVPENAVLGYVTDTEPGSVIEQSLFLSAQYVLAPRLLDRSAGHERVFGNFTRPADFNAFARAKGLRLERDFGNGVVLFRKEP